MEITDLKGKKILVIGSEGYLGKHINHFLRLNGVTTFCADVTESSMNNYKKINLYEKDSLVDLDLNVDFIYFFSGLTGTYGGFEYYENYLSVNELGLLNLLDSIRKSPFRPKIIFPSTRLIYKGKNYPIKEDDEKETKTIYSVNKLAAEGYLQSYGNSFDIPFTIFRICVPYGNLVSSDYSFGTIGFFIQQAKSGKNITLYGGGESKRTFTYVKDLCHQIISASLKKDSDGQIFNVGGETLSLKEAAIMIANRFNVSVLEIPWPERDLRIESGHTFFDDVKLKSLIEVTYTMKFNDFANKL